MDPRWPIVLFDLDGTLVNTVPLIVAAYQYAVRAVVGIELTDAHVRELIGRPLIDNCRELAGDRAAEVYATYVRWTVDHNEDLLQRYPGMEEAIQALQQAGIKLGVCTNKRLDSAQLSMRTAGLTHVIPILTTFEDTPAPKPHPAPLVHSLERLGGTPDKAAYIGDAVVDVQAAKAAGMTAIAVTWGAGTREALAAAEPDVLIDTREELVDFLLE